MGKIYCIIGKSSTGKDSLFKRILEDKPRKLSTLITYTTRPIRSHETNGVEYFFSDIPTFEKQKASGQVIEYRCYHTVLGDWYYYTLDDGQINDHDDYLVNMTLEGYEHLRDYYGSDRVIPLYIEVEDGIRLTRALEREKKQAVPQYREMCRRFLTDDTDFSEENIVRLGITRRFQNIDFETCLHELEEVISLG